MELRPEFLLPAIAKTLKDVVLPAVDADHQVAQEQLNLAIGFLNILTDRLPMFFAFDIDELRRHLALAESLAGMVGPDAGNDTAIADARRLLAASANDPAAIVAATRALRHTTAAMIELGHARGDTALCARISREVSAFAKVQLDRERAWVLPMGFENGADPIPDIASQLATATG